MNPKFKTLFLTVALFQFSTPGIYAQNNITVTNVEQINTPAIEFSPTTYHHGLVYVSSEYRHGRKDNKLKDNTFDLMYADLGPNGKLSKPAPLSLKVNTPYHEGPVAFTDNMNRMYFTRNNIRGKKNRHR